MDCDVPGHSPSLIEFTQQQELYTVYFMDHHRLTGPRRGIYLIRDNISNALENDIVKLLEDIL